MNFSDAVRIWNNPNKIFGLSTHNIAQAKDAGSLSPDYIGVGPVFATPTKDKPDPVMGLDSMREIIENCPVTTVAIGGINEDNLPRVLEHGAVNFCAVREIMQSRHPGRVINRMMKVWETFYGKHS